MTGTRQARKIALDLPGAYEQDHFRRPSFRVKGRIFATLPDSEHVNVMIGAFDVDGVVRQYPAACQELWWGKKLSGVRVTLRAATPDLIRELMARRVAEQGSEAHSTCVAKKTRRWVANAPAQSG